MNKISGLKLYKISNHSKLYGSSSCYDKIIPKGIKMSSSNFKKKDAIENNENKWLKKEKSNFFSYNKLERIRSSFCKSLVLSICVSTIAMSLVSCGSTENNSSIPQFNIPNPNETLLKDSNADQNNNKTNNKSENNTKENNTVNNETSNSSKSNDTNNDSSSDNSNKSIDASTNLSSNNTTANSNSNQNESDEAFEKTIDLSWLVYSEDDLKNKSDEEIVRIYIDEKIFNYYYQYIIYQALSNYPSKSDINEKIYYPDDNKVMITGMTSDLDSFLCYASNKDDMLSWCDQVMHNNIKDYLEDIVSAGVNNPAVDKEVLKKYILNFSLTEDGKVCYKDLNINDSTTYLNSELRFGNKNKTIKNDKINACNDTFTGGMKP